MSQPIPPTAENVRTALSFVSPDLSRDEWVRILISIKSGLGEDGEAIAKTWSEQGQSYNHSDFRDTWKSIRADGRITIGTLWRYALDAGWKPDGEARLETTLERQSREQERRKRDQETAEQEARKQTDALQSVQAIYNLSQAGESSYLALKGVTTVPGLRIIDAKAALAIRSFGPNIMPDAGLLLVIPMHGRDGKLCGLQAIDSHGNKGFMWGCKKGVFVIGAAVPNKPIAIVEGLATGLSIHESTGYAVAVAFDAGKLKSVAELIQDKYAGRPILVCGDRGKGQAEAEKAAADVGVKLAVPDFTGLAASDDDTDFNDLHRLAGMPTVSDQLEKVLSSRDGATLEHSPLEAIGQNGTLPESLQNLSARLVADPLYPYLPGVLRQLVLLEQADPRQWNAIKAQLKKGGVVLRDLGKAMLKDRTNLNAEQQEARQAKVRERRFESERKPNRVGQYEVINGAIHRWKETNDGEVEVRLCNFDARIIREVMRDDGTLINDTFILDGHFIIEGKRQGGVALEKTEVPFSEFTSLSWITRAWGNQAYIEAGLASRDHLRAAIQKLSGEVERQTIYGHTGWRYLDGEWFYLSGSGALGAGGTRTDIEVDAGVGHMRHYRLPDPPMEAKAAVQASLRLLDIAPGNPTIGASILCGVYRAPLAECAAIDMSLFLSGPTGVFKSEISSLGLQHFGSEFSARAIPANWGDTPTDVELKLYAAKDAFCPVDDFKPNGKPKMEADKLHASADRVFRSVGNGVSRGRRQANLKQRPDYPARSFVIASGEELPRGQSCRARLTIVEVRRGDVDKITLTELQKAGRSGLLAQAMAAYIQWLAPQVSELKMSIRDLLIAERDAAIQAGLSEDHNRVPENVAQLLVGARFLTQFAVHVGAVEDAHAFFNYIKLAIYQTAMAQGEHLEDQDEIHRFFSLLNAVLSSRRAHIVDLNTLGAPPNPQGWGWTVEKIGVGPTATERKIPGGNLIGWLEGEKLYLDSESAFAMVAMMARDQGETFTISPNGLWKRFADKGLLLERKLDKRKDGTSYLKNKCEKRIGGKKLTTLICVSLDFLVTQGGGKKAETAETLPPNALSGLDLSRLHPAEIGAGGAETASESGDGSIGSAVPFDSDVAMEDLDRKSLKGHEGELENRVWPGFQPSAFDVSTKNGKPCHGEISGINMHSLVMTDADQEVTRKMPRVGEKLSGRGGLQD